MLALLGTHTLSEQSSQHGPWWRRMVVAYRCSTLDTGRVARWTDSVIAVVDARDERVLVMFLARWRQLRSNGLARRASRSIKGVVNQAVTRLLPCQFLDVCPTTVSLTVASGFE
jgi:hypothetical protein